MGIYQYVSGFFMVLGGVAVFQLWMILRALRGNKKPFNFREKLPFVIFFLFGVGVSLLWTAVF